MSSTTGRPGEKASSSSSAHLSRAGFPSSERASGHGVASAGESVQLLKEPAEMEQEPADMERKIARAFSAAFAEARDANDRPIPAERRITWVGAMALLGLGAGAVVLGTSLRSRVSGCFSDISSRWNRT
jgi:hypothetical protein